MNFFLQAPIVCTYYTTSSTKSCQSVLCTHPASCSNFSRNSLKFANHSSVKTYARCRDRVPTNDTEQEKRRKESTTSLTQYQLQPHNPFIVLHPEARANFEVDTSGFAIYSLHPLGRALKSYCVSWTTHWYND